MIDRISSSRMKRWRQCNLFKRKRVFTQLLRKILQLTLSSSAYQLHFTLPFQFRLAFFNSGECPFEAGSVCSSRVRNTYPFLPFPERVHVLTHFLTWFARHVWNFFHNHCSLLPTMAFTSLNETPVITPRPIGKPFANEFILFQLFLRRQCALFFIPR